MARDGAVSMSFSLKKNKPKVLKNFLSNTGSNADVHEAPKQIILGVSGSRVQLAKKDVTKKVRVIPICLNPWQTQAKEKKLGKASEDSNAARKRAAAKGLLKATTGGDDGEESDDGEHRIINLDGGVGHRSQLEIVMKQKKALETDEHGSILSNADKLKKELSMRPQAQSFEGTSYKINPIRGFGKAMLLGMGWKPSKRDVNPNVVTARPHRVGLGALEHPSEVKKRKQKPSEVKQRKRPKNKKTDTASPAPKKRRKDTKKSEKKKRKKEVKKKSKRTAETGPTPMWIVPCARVSIVSKKRLPKYYKQAGVIFLIADPTAKECHVRLDSGTVVENVKQRYLQTEIPLRKGRPVIVVAPGELQGSQGRMLDFSGKTGIGAIQLSDTLEVHKLSQDDFAAFSAV